MDSIKSTLFFVFLLVALFFSSGATPSNDSTSSSFNLTEKEINSRYSFDNMPWLIREISGGERINLFIIDRNLSSTDKLWGYAQGNRSEIIGILISNNASVKRIKDNGFESPTYEAIITYEALKRFIDENESNSLDNILESEEFSYRGVGVLNSLITGITTSATGFRSVIQSRLHDIRRSYGLIEGLMKSQNKTNEEVIDNIRN